MLVYSVEDRYSFEHLKEWVKDASEYIDISTSEWALIGNKGDLTNGVENSDVEMYRTQLHAKFYTVSAKTGKNVLEAFNDLIRTIHEKCAKQTQSRQPQETIVIERVESTTCFFWNLVMFVCLGIFISQVAKSLNQSAIKLNI